MSQTSQTAPWAKISFWDPRGPRIITNSLAGVAFGSRVAGDFGPRTDYDLAVVVLSMPDQKEIRRLNSTLKTKTGLPVDLFFATPHGIQVRKKIDPMVHSLLKTGRFFGANSEIGGTRSPLPLTG